MRASGRVLTTGHTEGFVRLVCGDSNVVLGGQFVGTEASELISEIALAADEGLPTDELAEVIQLTRRSPSRSGKPQPTNRI